MNIGIRKNAGRHRLNIFVNSLDKVVSGLGTNTCVEIIARSLCVCGDVQYLYDGVFISTNIHSGVQTSNMMKKQSACRLLTPLELISQRPLNYPMTLQLQYQNDKKRTEFISNVK